MGFVPMLRFRIVSATGNWNEFSHAGERVRLNVSQIKTVDRSMGLRSLFRSLFVPVCLILLCSIILGSDGKACDDYAAIVCG